MTGQLPKISTHLGYFGSGGDRYNTAGYQTAVAPRDRVLLAYCATGESLPHLSRTQITLFDVDWLYR